MPHQSFLVRKDYERKMNCCWPYSAMLKFGLRQIFSLSFLKSVCRSLVSTMIAMILILWSSIPRWWTGVLVMQLQIPHYFRARLSPECLRNINVNYITSAPRRTGVNCQDLFWTFVECDYRTQPNALIFEIKKFH